MQGPREASRTYATSARLPMPSRPDARPARKAASAPAPAPAVNGQGDHPEDVKNRQREESRRRKDVLAATFREEQIVGAALFDAETARALRDLLKPTDFGVPVCESAFRCIMSELEGETSGVSVASVARRMQRDRAELSDGREGEWLEKIRLASPGQTAALIEARDIADKRNVRIAVQRAAEIVAAASGAGAATTTYASLCNQLRDISGGEFIRATDILGRGTDSVPRLVSPRHEDTMRAGDIPIATIFPPWFADYAAACAFTQSSSLELCVQAGLAAASSALAPWFNVAIKPGWVEPATLWTVGVMRSGGKKSPAMKGMWSSRFWYEAALRDHRKTHVEMVRARASAMKHVAKELSKQVSAGAMRLEELATNAAVIGKNEGTGSARALAATALCEKERAEHELRMNQLAKLNRDGSILSASAQLPLVFIQQPTPESMWSHAPNNPGHYVCIVDDEGDIFAGKARFSEGGKNENEAIFLCGYEGRTHMPSRVENGEGPRFPNLGPHTRIDIHQMVQRRKFIAMAEGGGLNDKGFLNRMLFFWPVEDGDEFEATNQETIPEQVALDYTERTRAHYYDTMDWQLREMELNLPVTIPLSDGARDAFFGWIAQNEHRWRSKRGDCYHIGEWASKLPTSIAKVALVLELLWSDRGIAHFLHPDARIGEDAMKRALALSGFFIGHALLAFNAMGGSTTEVQHDAEMAMRVLGERTKASYTPIEIERYLKWDRRTQYMTAAQVKRCLVYAVREGILDVKQEGKEQRYVFRAARPGRTGGAK